MRIIIGFDGSPGAEAAVKEVVSRKWREHSEVHLVTATAPIAPSTIGRFVPPIVHWVEEVNQSEREWIEKLAEKSLMTLREAGLEAKLYIPSGNPKQVLVEEAERTILEEAMSHHQGQMAATARALGLERSHLYKKAKALGLRGKDDGDAEPE